CCLALLLVPATITTFGLRIRNGGLVAEGLAFKKTWQGEIAAVNGMCGGLPRGATRGFLRSRPRRRPRPPRRGGPPARGRPGGGARRDGRRRGGEHHLRAPGAGGAGRARHRAGRPARGAPRGRAITAHALRRADQAHHAAAERHGRERPDRPAAAHHPLQRGRLYVGADGMSIPPGWPGAEAAESGVASAPVSVPSPQGPYVSIILPCYNEQDHVSIEVERICAAMDASGYDYELLAFDDASTDRTLARLHEVAPDFPHLQIVHFHRNGGSGTVRRIGTQRARGEIVV